MYSEYLKENVSKCLSCGMVRKLSNYNFTTECDKQKGEIMQKFENGQEVEYYDKGYKKWMPAKYLSIGKNRVKHFLTCENYCFGIYDEYIRPVKEDGLTENENKANIMEPTRENIEFLHNKLKEKDDRIGILEEANKYSRGRLLEKDAHIAGVEHFNKVLISKLEKYDNALADLEISIKDINKL